MDARSDLYSLGVVLFERSTGKLPFEADSAVSLLLAQVSKPPPRLLEVQPDLPGGPGAAGTVGPLARQDRIDADYEGR